MSFSRLRPSVASAALLASAIAQAPQPATSTAIQTVYMRSVPADTTRFRLGWGITGKLPATAMSGRIGQHDWLFWDLNGDGQITPGNGDGLTMPDGRFVVELPRILLLPVGQVEIRHRAPNQLTLHRQALALRPALVTGAAQMTFIRMRHGLCPLVLDEAASKDCLAHCDYMRRNKADESASVHDEDPKKPGFTEAGRLAAMQSCIGFHDDLGAEIRACDATVWHCVPLVDPEVRSFGVGATTGYCMIRPIGHAQRARPFFHPAPDSTDIPWGFAPGGELPNPVPGTDLADKCGYPIFVTLPWDFAAKLKTAEVTDSNGQKVEGTASCPKTPANKDEWPSNSNSAVFIPRTQLRPGTTYKVAFLFEDGTRHEWAWATAPAPARKGR